MKKDLISIIIPIYNCEKYISKCLDNLINQDYKNIEIILIDDGSTDNSYDVCKKYANKDNRIILLNEKNSGPSCARNLGIEKSSGEYIMFVDADDYIDKDVIRKMKLNHQKNTLIAVKHKEVINDKVKECNYSKNEYLTNEYLELIVNNNIIGSVWGYLFDSKYIKKMEFDINTKCMEDTIFLINYIYESKIEKIKFIDDSYYYYVLNINSITAKKYSDTESYLKRYENYDYSLRVIDELTNKIYYKAINNNRVIILENQMSNLEHSIKEYKKFLNKIKIDKYCGKSMRYKLFSELFINKKIHLLKLYFYCISILRKIRNIIRK